MLDVFEFVGETWIKIFQLQRSTILIYGFYVFVLSILVGVLTVIRGKK